VVNPDSAGTAGLVLESLVRWSRSHRIHYLVIDPPYNSKHVVDEMSQLGFRPSPSGIPPTNLVTATTVIDLCRSLNQILAAMRPDARRNVRKGTEFGFKFRIGCQDDLEQFFQLMLQVCKRRGEKPNPPNVDFFHNLWREYESRGWVRLLLGEYDGELINGEMVFAFGDTFRMWKRGWNQGYRKNYPNHAIIWFAIQLAKEAGFKSFDFVQVDPGIAPLLAARKKVPQSWKKMRHFGPTRYKMSFGENVLFYPGVLCLFTDPGFGPVLHLLAMALTRMPLSGRLLNKIWGRSVSA
jgi:lipid II:glycine glycyltransferase (peptidoglycan interpeptide bridge formation enzyme)